MGFQCLNKYTIGPYIGPSFAKILNDRIQFGPLPSGTRWSVSKTLWTVPYNRYSLIGSPYPLKSEFYWITLVLETIKQFILICVLEDAYFYYVHRLTHEVKWFYKWVHYLHHEWTAPVAISVSYMHPIEWILVNMTLVYVGPVIIGAHAAVVFSYYCFIFTKGIIETVCHIKRVNKKRRQQKIGAKKASYFCWRALRPSIHRHSYIFVDENLKWSLQGIVNHSGYIIPGLPNFLGAEFHDNHHKLNRCNYGSYGIFDRLHGTYKTGTKND